MDFKVATDVSSKILLHYQNLFNRKHRNNRFAWNPECHNAFEKFKATLIDSSGLKHQDYSSAFIVDMDASGNSLGAVLSNIVNGVEYPVAFGELTSLQLRTQTNQ